MLLDHVHNRQELAQMHNLAERGNTPSQEPEGVRVVVLIYMQCLVQSQVAMIHAGGEVEVRYAKTGDQEQQGMS